MNQSKIWEKYQDQLDSLETTDSTRLFELSFCRDFSRELHRGKSKLMAEPQAKGLEQAKQLAIVQEKLMELIAQNQVPSDITDGLSQLFDPEVQVPKKDKKISEMSLPENLLKSIEKRKLERPDRKWEKAICFEAIRIGWNFWTVDCWIEITQAEEFHEALSKKIYPNGVLLFVEGSDEFHDLGTSAPADSSMTVWPGKWTATFSPEVKPEELELDHLKGFYKHNVDPIWKMIYHHV